MAKGKLDILRFIVCCEDCLVDFLWICDYNKVEVDAIVDVWAAILAFIGEVPLSDPVSSLTLAQIICGTAIRIPTARDEVRLNICALDAAAILTCTSITNADNMPTLRR